MWGRSKEPPQPKEPAKLVGIPLPEPHPALVPPPGGDAREVEHLYFDPARWNSEIVNHLVSPAEDPIVTGRGLVEGQGTAALFISDIHLADGAAGGDDFLESHLHADDEYGGLLVGSFPSGESRAALFLSTVTFALQRLARYAGANARLDIILNGDVINFLELIGRGGTFVAPCHAPFFRALAALRDQATVYWLRGNHDYVVPSGPWRAGEFYTNPALRTMAEHGDFWDKENWPPGPTNKGSRFAIEMGSAFEVHASVTESARLKYLMAGVDNLRPWNTAAIRGFLDRRSKYSDTAAVAAVIARLKNVGAADDSAAYQGALTRRKGKWADWLMVQGHTHVPAAVPGTYYNLGSWISTLVEIQGQETQIEAFPCLFVYVDPDGRRVEEYFVIGQDVPGANPQAVLQTPESVNALRATYGYSPLPS
jgi:UDP-2,3-diacylglucosamine pyrophosphatase LpxH